MDAMDESTTTVASAEQAALTGAAQPQPETASAQPLAPIDFLPTASNPITLLGTGSEDAGACCGGACGC